MTGGAGGRSPSGAAVLVCVAVLLFLRRRPLAPAAALVLGPPAVGLALATVTAADPVAALPGFVRYLQIFVLVPAAVLLLVRDAAGLPAASPARSSLLAASSRAPSGVHQYVTGTGASYMGQDIRAVGTFGPWTSWGWPRSSPTGWSRPPRTRCAPRPARRAGCGRGAAVRAALLLVPLALSFSRGAWIATAAAALAVLLLTGLRQAVRAAGGAGAPRRSCWSAASASGPR